jgi:hypothetical protein
MKQGAKMVKELSLGLVVVLAACGGSDTKTLAERFDLQAEASAWENHMPIALLPGQEPPCTPLIILFKIVANQPLPADISTKSISLGKNASVLWAQDVSKTESSLSNERTIEGRASGCRTSAFSEGDTLDVKVILTTSNEQSEVKTTVKLLVVS